MSFEDWSNYWLKTHGPIFLNTQIAKQNLIRYEQLHVNQTAKQMFEAAGYKVPDFDGVVVFEAESYEKLVATITSEEWFREVIADGDKIFDQDGRSYGYYAFSTLLDKGKKAVPGPKFQEGRAQLIVQMTKKEGLSREDFEKYWLEEHSKILTGFEPAKEGLSKHEQLHVHILESHPEVKPTEWDGIALFEAESIEKIGSILSSEEYRALAEPDQAKFLDKKRGFLPVDVAVLMDQDV